MDNKKRLRFLNQQRKKSNSYVDLQQALLNFETIDHKFEFLKNMFDRLHRLTI